MFRTYNASFTLDDELAKLDNHMDKKAICRSETTQLKFYNDANYQVLTVLLLLLPPPPPPPLDSTRMQVP